MLDFFAQIWLSVTRRMLTYCMAILSLSLGIAAFLCLTAFNQSYTSNLARQFNMLSEFSVADGPLVVLRVGTKQNRQALNTEMISQQVIKTIPKDIGIMVAQSFDVKVGRHAMINMPVYAVSSHWLKLYPDFNVIGDKIAGRLFTNADDSSTDSVCIIDQYLAKALPSNMDPVGQVLKVEGRPFRVIGVVMNRLGPRPYGLLIVNLHAAQDLLRTHPVENLNILVRSDDKKIESEMVTLEGDVQAALGSQFEISSEAPWLDMEESRYQLKYTRIFLVMLSLLPLVVGLLGTVSMLLANLNNRVREIGIHMALGSTRLRQASLVLCEAGLTGLSANLMGIPIGVFVLHILTSVWGAELHVTSRSIIAAVVLGTVTALLAGFIPARAAMMISPCEALRAE